LPSNQVPAITSLLPQIDQALTNIGSQKLIELSAAEEMQMMRKLYNQMVLEKNQIKPETPVQIGRAKKKTAEKELAMAE
jgi:hypothetical protein